MSDRPKEKEKEENIMRRRRERMMMRRRRRRENDERLEEKWMALGQKPNELPSIWGI